MKNNSASLILPIYNQADHLERVVESYAAAFSQFPVPLEIILVPNGCRDRSEEICRSLAAKLPLVRCEPLQLGGWGRAVRHGLSKAEGELAGYTNLARTKAEDLLLCFLYALSNPRCVIKANRKVRDSLFRRLGSLLYNLECRMLFDLPYWDINGTPKVFWREHEGLFLLTRDDDLVDLEFAICCRRAGYPVIEVPILSTVRHGGRSTTGLGSARRMYLGAIELWRR